MNHLQKSAISRSGPFRTVISGRLWLASALALAVAGSGCEALPAGGGSPTLITSTPSDGRERWTIRAFHTKAPQHAQQAERLAEALRRVDGLRAQDVRVATDHRGSTIYYGAYVKIADPRRGSLIFPPEYQRDIELIRRLSMGAATPFFFAAPELMDRFGEGERDQWDVSRASGAYTLQIAVFYNTAEFTARREAARQYVRALRDAGYSAYYRHEGLHSSVFVGDFGSSDVVQTHEGLRFGPRVEMFISRNEAEFRHISENGQIIRQVQPDGRMAAPLSYLVPVPRD